jgi:hypothetical protein
MKHVIRYVEESNDQPDEILFALTAQHGTCLNCEIALWDKEHAVILVQTHIDGDFCVERYCSNRCLVDILRPDR